MPINMDTHHISKKQIFIIIILLLGVAVSVYLATQPQIFRSRATTDVYNAIDIKDAEDGSVITCNGSACTTEADSVKIKLIDDPNKLFKR